ncbi:hypothetical protein LOAG_15961, partial [Loa loa]
VAKGISIARILSKLCQPKYYLLSDVRMFLGKRPRLSEKNDKRRGVYLNVHALHKVKEEPG